MRHSIFSIIVLAIFAITACNKDENSVTQLTDDQLILAIQQATNKQAITAEQLPSDSKIVLDQEYSESYTEEALLAPDLGYEVGMRRGEGSRIGEHANVYFDMDGRKLRSRKGEGYRNKHGKDRKECFEFVYPVSFTMPDGSTVTGNNREELHILIKAWYISNPDTEEKPSLNFPVDIVFKDSTISTINNEEEMRLAFASCAHERPKCFDLVFPVTLLMPDGSTITGDSREELSLAVRSWYEANPGTDERPELQFPVEIIYEDGTTVTINNHEEMRLAHADCVDDDD